MSDEADIFWGRCATKTKEEIAASPFVYDHELPQPHWRNDNTCSHCGGLRPSLALEAIRAGAVVEPTDKNYKIYVRVPDPDVGKLRVVSTMNFTPAEYDPATQGWEKPDFAAMKASGWTSETAQWVKWEPHKAEMTAKCYLNHFSEAQAVEFVLLREAGKMNLAHPGRFYSGLCFGIYKDAIEKAVAAQSPKPPEPPASA